jgi:hypothetical protein
MNILNADALAFASVLIGAGALATDAAFGTNIATLFGPAAPKILAGFGLLVPLGQAIRNFYNPSSGPSPAPPATPAAK